ncbi:alpha/beta fold hydrolase [Brevundimonas sp. R86498]|uniref:alpha/beta fold hydrolase n=1 Tax=Brevundimonas sp. R86498 TaxID=3093845 RepID=UPI0037C9FE27
MSNAVTPARATSRAQRPSARRLKPWQAALIGLAACTPSLVVAFDAWAAPPVVQSAPAFTSDRLSVEVVGTGPDVILIPGFGCSREVWRVEADRLKATHRVHLVQLAGFAGEPWSHGDGPFIGPVVEELARYIREQGLTSPALAGHSMGSLIGVRLAQAHPGSIGRLMSVDSLPFFGALRGPQVTPEQMAPVAEQTAQALRTMSDAAFRDAQVRSATGYSRDPLTRERMVEWTLTSDRQAMATAMRDVLTTDARPGLATMTIPVTVLYAADADGGAPAAQADQAWGHEYAALPGATLIRVDGSRHFIMSDQPARFAVLMDAFLK